MPTINEVWEQALRINANLVILHEDAEKQLACCRKTNEGIDELHDLVSDGFAAVMNGFTAVVARQDLTNQLLALQVRQNETIICALEHVSRNTCDLSNDSQQNTPVLSAIGEGVASLAHMFESSHPDAALEHQRAREAQDQLEECCPPDPVAPRCEYKPCPKPTIREPGTPPKLGAFDERPKRTAGNRA